MSRSWNTASSDRGLSQSIPRQLIAVAASGILLAGVVGPLTPLPARAGNPATVADEAEALAYPNGRVVATSPAPITTPASSGGMSPDPTVGGEPLFLPYTPPADTAELASERTAQSRTLANPDGTFTTEVSDGPINFPDASGAWQPLRGSASRMTDTWPRSGGPSSLPSRTTGISMRSRMVVLKC